MMTHTATYDVPEQGQLVKVRHRRYVVTDVVGSTLPTSPLFCDGKPQHLITLASVEEDALGEELQVIWELEPGARVYDVMALPAPMGFDEPRRQDAFLNAVRWGAASSADTQVLQAPFRSGIDLEDYQLDPVVRAIQMPRQPLPRSRRDHRQHRPSARAAIRYYLIYETDLYPDDLLIVRDVNSDTICCVEIRSADDSFSYDTISYHTSEGDAPRIGEVIGKFCPLDWRPY